MTCSACEHVIRTWQKSLPSGHKQTGERKFEPAVPARHWCRIDGPLTFEPGLALVLAGYFTWRHRLGLAAVCMLCFFALFRPSVAFAGEECRPHHYPDGDTFYYRDAAGKVVRVRVAGFDAPERGQPFSRVATDKMRELTRGGAECDCYKQDRHGRSVCNVRIRGHNVASLMLAEGLGCIDPRFESEAQPQERQAARAALQQAQQARRGIWSQPDPICAFDYRRSNRAQ